MGCVALALSRVTAGMRRVIARSIEQFEKSLISET
jgi:hypothetical protein